MIKNKRGISPLIATVLLIGFTIVLAAIVFKWGTLFTKQTTGSTDCQSQATIACAQEVQISLGAVEFTSDVSGAKKLTKLVVNNEAASKIITAADVRVEINDQQVQNKRIDLGNTPLTGGESRDIVAGGPVTYDQVTDLNKIVAVHVTPIIKETIQDGTSCLAVCSQQESTATQNNPDNTRIKIS